MPRTELSVVDGIIALVSELNRQIHELLADIRAAATISRSPDARFGEAFEAGARAYSRGPVHAVFITAQIAARRLDQARQAREDSGRPAEAFPRERLERVLRVRPANSRRDAGSDVIDYFETFVNGLVPEPAPLEKLIATHGYPAFAAMLKLATETAAILVDSDPSFGDIDELFQLEAAADELEWQSFNDPDS